MGSSEKSSAPGEWPREREFRDLLDSIVSDPSFKSKPHAEEQRDCLVVIDDRVVNFLTETLAETPLEEAQTVLLKALRVLREFLGERLKITRFPDRRTEKLAFAEGDVQFGERGTPEYRWELERRVDAEVYIGRLKTLLLLRILGRERLEKEVGERRKVPIDVSRQAVHEQLVAGSEIGRAEKPSYPTPSAFEDLTKRETTIGGVHVKYKLDPTRPQEFIVYVGNEGKGVHRGFTFNSAPAVVEGFHRICEVVGTLIETYADIGSDDQMLLELIRQKTADLRDKSGS